MDSDSDYVPSPIKRPRTAYKKKKQSSNLETPRTVKTSSSAKKGDVGIPKVEAAGSQNSKEMSQSLQDEEIYKIVDPAKRLLAALEHGFMTDYEICIGDERFACHINIVTLVSPKFASMLTKKKEQLIAWLAADPLHRHLFRLLLQIIYGRERTTGTEDTKTLLQLGYLAHKMQVPMVVNHCAMSCHCAMSSDEYNTVDENLWLMIQFTQDVDVDPELVPSFKLAFNHNLPRILQAENFSVYTKNRLKTILRRQKLFGVTEVELFQACVSWANAKEDEAESRRAALRKVLPWIRFRLFSVKDFAKHVSPTGLLSAEQERDILRSCALGKNFMPQGFSKCIIKRGYCPGNADSTKRGISEQTDEASPESGDSVKENVVASDAAYVIDVPDLPSDEDDEEMSNSGAEKIAKFLYDKIRFWAARNNNVLTDTTIIVGSEEFKCHSFVVSCSSPKLAALLRKRNPAQLPNVDPRHFRKLLEIIYTGEVIVRDDLKTLLQVGRLAFDLQVPTAFKYCAVVLGNCDRVKIKLFFDTFDFAKLINDAQLMHSCLKVNNKICKRLNVVLNSPCDYRLRIVNCTVLPILEYMHLLFGHLILASTLIVFFLTNVFLSDSV